MTPKTFKENFDLRQWVIENMEYSQNGDNILICCPFHNEETPSCLITKERYRCFGACGGGDDAITFLIHITGKTFQEILSSDEFEMKILQIKTSPKVRKESIITSAAIANYHKQLLRKTCAQQYLLNRGFDEASIIKAKIGHGIPIDVYGKTFSHPRFVIPHYDKNKKLCGVKYRIDPKYAHLEKQKYIAHPGMTSVIYNQECFNCDSIVYVGSQFDAAILWHRYGIAAIAPPSENIFKDEWIPHFKDKKILIWLDNDKTGIESSLNVYGKIRNVVKSANIYVWGNEFKKKEDFTDFLMRKGIMEVKRVINENNK